MHILILPLLFLLQVTAANTSNAVMVGPSNKPPAALSEVEVLTAQNKLKDYQLADKEFAVLVERFMGSAEVKAVQAKQDGARKELADLQKQLLDKYHLDGKEWAVDFSKGIFQPVPKDPKTIPAP